MAEGAARGPGYWAGQIIACAVLGVGGIAGGVAIIVFADTGTSDTGAGEGVVAILIGIAFLVTLAWVLWTLAKTTKEQRAVHAWAIMQQQGIRWNGSPLNNDGRAMGIAAMARDGELSAAELRRLQALRPEVTYPGNLPPAP